MKSLLYENVTYITERGIMPSEVEKQKQQHHLKHAHEDHDQHIIHHKDERQENPPVRLHRLGGVLKQDVPPGGVQVHVASAHHDE